MENRDVDRTPGGGRSERWFLVRSGHRREYKENLPQIGALADYFRDSGKNERDDQEVYQQDTADGEQPPFVVRQRWDVMDTDQRDLIRTACLFFQSRGSKAAAPTSPFPGRTQIALASADAF